MTGSAIAIPLLGAASAHAADSVTWDRLAECESGGSWDAVPGNGHFGGLQMTQEQWVNHGGLDYALSADKATRSQQIIVAERVLDDLGPAAWPGCAVLAGLHSSESPSPSDSASADPSTGSHDGDESGDPSDSSTPSGSSSSGSSDSSDSSGSSDSSPSDSPSSSSPSESRSPSASSGATGQGKGDESGDAAGRHRGDRADEDSGRDSAGRHASRGGGKGQDAADGAYTVRPGDNLWAIAEAHDLDGGWTALYEANKKTVGDDPDLILPGQRLDLS